MDKQYKLGIFYGLSAYLIWGVLPIYWRQIQHVDAMEILASRFIWSAVFVFLLMLATGKLKLFVDETKAIFNTWKTSICMILAAITISFNWGIFIWAVEVGRIVETSMGYYINPLVSVLFGIGVIIVKNGSLPWVSVSLAATFAFYGLLKKLIKAQALTSIMLETLLISPLMLYYLYYLGQHGGNVYQSCDNRTLLYLIGAGIATATPLLFFTGCAKVLPLYMVGFMQYIAPSITLLIGIFMYGEAFTFTHAVAFGCIWVGLFFFTISQLRRI